MVKNYLLGMLLNGLDGVLNVSDMVKGIILEEIPFEAFDQLVQTIKTITAEDLQALAQKYLQPKTFWEVMVAPGNEEVVG